MRSLELRQNRGMWGASDRAAVLLKTGKIAKTAMRPQGHDSPQAPFAALGLK
jgi:hypothetical protein